MLGALVLGSIFVFATKAKMSFGAMSTPSLKLSVSRMTFRGIKAIPCFFTSSPRSQVLSDVILIICCPP